MERYIDAYKLEKDLPQSVPKHNVIINGNEYPVFLVDHILHKIRNYPTADVVEVKRGKWIDLDITEWQCSKCHYRVERWNNTPYCPNCGADMRGDAE